MAAPNASKSWPAPCANLTFTPGRARAQAQRPDAMDVWPSPAPPGDAPVAGGSVASGANSGGLGLFLEPSSPTLQRAGAGAAGASPRAGSAAHFSAVHFTQQKSNQAVRKELQAHLATHQGLLSGYTDYLQVRFCV